MDQTINGKRVTLVAKVPAAVGYPLAAEYAPAADSGQLPAYDLAARMIAAAVESWEFDGDPKDPATWDLDTGEFLELMALAARKLRGVDPNSRPAST